MMTMQWMDWPATGKRGVFDELDRMRKRLDNISRGGFGGWPVPSSGVYPLTNVTEDKDNFYIRAELPGMDPKDIDISITGRVVTLAGAREIEAEKGASYHRRERRAGTFSRMITLPMDVDSPKAEAKSDNGVLTVKHPKAEAAKPRQIQVKA